jgi:acetolactate synthase-1/2/3 large subunit
MVAQLQRLFNDYVYQTKFYDNPDFVQLAKTYKINGEVVEKPGELKETIQNALKQREATVIDIRIDANELLPIVPPGSALNQMKKEFDDVEDLE